MDLNTMSLAELRRLQTRISAEIQKRSDVERRSLLKQFRKMAQDKGLSFSELIATGDESTLNAPTARRGRKPGSAKTQKSPPRYFHPDNPEWNWSGHGRRPQWFIDWVTQDKPIEALERKN
ncbi:MAG TPA: H-NS histone family protein [Rhodocyclaceae bacterium]|nr:H-NS histone family protein [Rhodocyclaceae bacterium]